MEFHELIAAILNAKTPEARERAVHDATAASWARYLDDIDRDNNVAKAQFWYDRREIRIADAQTMRRQTA